MHKPAVRSQPQNRWLTTVSSSTASNSPAGEPCVHALPAQVLVHTALEGAQAVGHQLRADWATDVQSVDCKQHKELLLLLLQGTMPKLQQCSLRWIAQPACQRVAYHSVSTHAGAHVAAEVGVHAGHEGGALLHAYVLLDVGLIGKQVFAHKVQLQHLLRSPHNTV